MTETTPTREFETLIRERRGPVDWITLNRPEALNTFNARMLDELRAYFTGLESDSSVRVVVLRGAGKHFCAGLDVKEMSGRIGELDAASVYAVQRTLSRIIVAMRRCPQPIVALLHGAAAGGGFSLALASDIRYCTPDTRMNAAFIQIGLTGCDAGASYLLQKLCGASIAAEYLMTGRNLPAARAYALGLVCEVVDAEQLEAAGEGIVADLLKAAPLALGLTKQGLNTNLAAPSLEAALELEDRQQALMALGPDFAARMRAFIGKPAR